MSDFTANFHAYNIATESELAEVLSHYSTDFVFSIVNEAIKNRLNSVAVIAPPNVIGAWEQNFKAIMIRYCGDGNNDVKQRVMRVREETYTEIINIICNTFSLNFTIDDNVDLYSAAFYLYDLLVCGFSSNLVDFFSKFIYKERASLYETLELAEKRKNKDSSTLYAKKIYKDMRLAIINANIEMVIDQILEIDIPFETIISTIYGYNSKLKQYMLSIISEKEKFYERNYVFAMKQPDIRPELMTSIRIGLLNEAASHDQLSDINNNITKGE